MWSSVESIRGCDRLQPDYTSQTEQTAFGVCFTSQALPPSDWNRVRRAFYSILVAESPLRLPGRQSAQQTSVEPTTSPPVLSSSAKSPTTSPDTWRSWGSQRVQCF